MNQAKRKDYADDGAFRQAYLSAVTAYEEVRRKIDAGVADPNNPELDQQEISLRREMESFTQLLGLKTGDVVQVPTWTPHALQHGVRVVEFQTPTYERYIVSFAQQVLTQDHWDTTHAVAKMHIDAPAQPTLPVVSPGVERIAAFDDFEAWRIDHSTSPQFSLPPNLPYAVCMSLTDATVANLTLQPEQACFIPHQACKQQVTISATHGHTLIAAPKLST